jgi:hypothetical protein
VVKLTAAAASHRNKYYKFVLKLLENKKKEKSMTLYPFHRCCCAKRIFHVHVIAGPLAAAVINLCIFCQLKRNNKYLE